VHSIYNVPHPAGTCDGVQWLIVLVNLTDSSYHNPNRPQVYFSGTVHGNERLGANVAVYLIEYLTSNYGSDPWVTQLLREREILITPFVNPSGYASNKREELTDEGQYYDINRDFPYNLESGNNRWFSTVGARATSKIFSNNLIVAALSYHAGQETIGYPWGSYNHAYISQSGDINATHSPDTSTFTRIGEALLEQSRSPGLSDFDVGSMTNLIYPWYGSLDDWAYGSGWDTSANARVSYCNPTTYAPYNNDEYLTNVDHIAASFYIVEASMNKDPPNSEYGGRGDIFCTECDSEGYVPRHLRITLSYFDLAQTYAMISTPQYMRDSSVLRISWRLNGWLVINSMSIDVQMPDSEEYVVTDMLTSSGNCNWEGTQTDFQHDINIPLTSDSQEVMFRLRFLVDQDFAAQSSPDPRVPPQAYTSRLRLEENFTYEINDRKITNVPRLYSAIIAPNGQVSFYEVHEDSQYSNMSEM
jgi:hypothetical protein